MFGRTCTSVACGDGCATEAPFVVVSVIGEGGGSASTTFDFGEAIRGGLPVTLLAFGKSLSLAMAREFGIANDRAREFWSEGALLASLGFAADRGSSDRHECDPGTRKCKGRSNPSESPIWSLARAAHSRAAWNG